MTMNIDEVAKAALALPEVEEGERHGRRTWFVNKKGFLWERPFSKADIKRWGDTTPLPQQPIVAFATEDLHEKEAILAEGLPGQLVEGPVARRRAAVVAQGQLDPQPGDGQVDDAVGDHPDADRVVEPLAVVGTATEPLHLVADVRHGAEDRAARTRR